LANLRQACPKRHAAVTAVPIFAFLLPDHRPCIVHNICVYTHVYDCVQTVYELPLLPNNTAVKHLHTNRSGSKCLLGIYRWGAGLAVTRRMRNTGQRVCLILKQKAVQAPLTDTFSSLSHSSRRQLLDIQYNNYTTHVCQNTETLWAGRSEDQMPVGGEIFRASPDRFWDPPSLVCSGYQVFTGDKAAGAWR